MEKQFLLAFDLQVCEAATLHGELSCFLWFLFTFRWKALICDQMDYDHISSFHAFLSITVKFLNVFLEQEKHIPELITNSMDTLTQYLCTLI